MMALIVLLLVVGAIVMFDAAAASWGADSRDSMPDTHRR